MTKEEFWAGVHRSSKELEKWPSWKLASVSNFAGDVASRILAKRKAFPWGCFGAVQQVACDVLRPCDGVECEP